MIISCIAKLWFINLIMKCVESVSFSVKINGRFSDMFKPSRGIRQGDPLSPYLFLLCGEGLSSMLKFCGQQFLSKGIRVGIHAPWVSHLLFADDCLVFTQASAMGATRLHAILETYLKGSGQLVNKNKSAIFFSGNCSDDQKIVVHAASGISTEAKIEKYLGLPTALGRSTDDEFEHIITRIRKLVKGWSPKTLSSAARETLVKAICQAIPAYSMSCFKLSKKLCKKITSIVARFLWGGYEKKRKIHWRKWQDIVIPKCHGGLGVRDFQLFNQAMLAKQGWRLLTKPESLCARVLKGKYFPNSNFMEARKKRNASHIWNAILFGREALTDGLIKRPGDGSTIRVWDDPWIPSNYNKKPLARAPGATVTMVSELMVDQEASWNTEKLEELFIPSDVSAIQAIPIGRFSKDFWSWTLESSGNFSVRLCYRSIAMKSRVIANTSSSGQDENRYWKNLWKLEVPLLVVGH
jgi:hypothetical protein